MTLASATQSLLGELSSAVDGAADEAVWLASVLERDGARLRATCRALAASDAEADDLLQETLLRALTHPPPDRERPVLPWLRTVARHLATDAHRARGRLDDAVDVDTLGEGGADDAATREAVDQALVGAVAQLGLAQLSAFLLQALLGLSAEEVADAVGRSPGNVRVLTHRARETLRGGAPGTEDARRRAVAGFVDRVCAAKVRGLHELLRETRPDRDLPTGTIGAVLRGRASRLAWERLVTATGAILGDTDAPSALWARAAALEETGAWSEARALYDRAVQSSREQGLDAVAARALLGLARQGVIHGDNTVELGASVPEGLELEHGTLRGGQLWRRGELDAAHEVYDRLLAGTMDDEERGAVLHNLALVDIHRGRLGAAREQALQALRLHRASGNTLFETRTLNALGMAAQNVGALAEARTWFEQALRIAPLSQTQSDSIGVHTNLGLLAQELGDLREAARCFHESLATARAHHLPRSEGIALANLGVNHHLAGRPHRAADVLGEAVRVVKGLDLPPLRIFVDAHLAAVRAHADPPGAAAELERCGEALRGLQDGGLSTLTELLSAWVALAADPLGGQLGVERALAAVARPGPDGAEPWSRRSVVVRIGAELVRRLASGAAQFSSNFTTTLSPSPPSPSRVVRSS